jgi:hypothetical protein
MSSRLRVKAGSSARSVPMARKCRGGRDEPTR